METIVQGEIQTVLKVLLHSPLFHLRFYFFYFLGGIFYIFFLCFHSHFLYQHVVVQNMIKIARKPCEKLSQCKPKARMVLYYTIHLVITRLGMFFLVYLGLPKRKPNA